MSLDQFKQEQQSKLEVFLKYWIMMNKIKPDEYPLDLTAGEWEEQYQIFDEVVQ